jgi:hypothetical protein
MDIAASPLKKLDVLLGIAAGARLDFSVASLELSGGDMVRHNALKSLNNLA